MREYTYSSALFLYKLRILCVESLPRISRCEARSLFFKVESKRTISGTRSAVRPIGRTRPQRSSMSLNKYARFECIGCGMLSLPSLEDLSAGAKPIRRHQCPVSIHTAAVKEKAAPFSLHFEDNASEILHSGHSIEVRFTPGDTLRRGPCTYTLRQLHFHTPSETFINGEHFPLETHFVYECTENESGPIDIAPDHHGPLLVLGAFAKAGASNPALRIMLENAPGEDEPPRDFRGYDPSTLLPASTRHYAFPGSLTTPPYTEPVEWIILTDPVEAAEDEIRAVREILGDNTRAIQPLNGRPVAFGE